MRTGINVSAAGKVRSAIHEFDLIFKGDIYDQVTKRFYHRRKR